MAFNQGVKTLGQPTISSSLVLLALARADTTQLSFNLKTLSPDILLSKSLLISGGIKEAIMMIDITERAKQELKNHYL